jgi:hypothetical protein
MKLWISTWHDIHYERRHEEFRWGKFLRRRNKYFSAFHLKNDMLSVYARGRKLLMKILMSWKNRSSLYWFLNKVSRFLQNISIQILGNSTPSSRSPSTISDPQTFV